MHAGSVSVLDDNLYRVLLLDRDPDADWTQLLELKIIRMRTMTVMAIIIIIIIMINYSVQ